MNFDTLIGIGIAIENKSNLLKSQSYTYMFCHPKIGQLDNAMNINKQICSFDIPA